MWKSGYLGVFALMEAPNSVIRWKVFKFIFSLSSLFLVTSFFLFLLHRGKMLKS